MISKRSAILLIDDDSDYAANLIDIFEAHGLRLDAAGTGSEGINAAVQGDYDLVLLDLRLPDLTGIEVLSKTKQECPDTEVIVETGYASLETAVQALDTGAFAYVIKPVNPEQLVSLCTRALERVETRRALRESEEKYRRFFEKNSDIVLVADMEGRILDANPAAVENYGYTVGELKAMAPGELMTAETRELMRPRIEQVRLAGDAVFETAHRRKDGSVIYLETRSGPIVYEGKPAILNVLRDITERLAMEEELRQSESKWKMLVTNLPDFVSILDEEGRFLFLNHYAEGFGEEEVLGSSVYEYIEESSIPVFRSAVMEAIATGEVQRFNHRAMGDVGKIRFYEDFAVPLGDGSRRYNIIVIARDITERKEAEEALRESEERYRAIFENASTAAIMMDSDATIVLANREFEKLAGYSRNEVEGKLKVSDFINQDDLERVMELGRLRKLDPSTAPSMYELRLVDKAGVSREVLASIDMIPGTELSVVFLPDITIRKKAEEAISRSASIVDYSEDAIFYKELDGTILSWNNGAARLYGYSAEEAVGQNVSILIPPDRADEVSKILEGIARGERFDHYDTVRLTKDGRLIDVSMGISPVKNAAGHVIGASSVARDISQRKEAEEKIRRVNAELEGFAGTVSHDLRGPLANIELAAITLIELLVAPQTDKARAEAAQVAEMMLKSSHRSINLMEKLLGLAEAGQAPGELVNVDVRKVVDRILDERAMALAEKGVKMRIDPDLGHVIADLTHIYQIFTNLIGNAIRYNDNPMPVIEVSNLGDGDRGSHRYLVRDNGSGIPVDSIDKVFEPFFKGKAGGTGIGLAIVEKIVKLYGGSVRAYNGNGACFEFTLRDFQD